MGVGLSPASPALFGGEIAANVKAANHMAAQSLHPSNNAPPTAPATNIAEQLDEQERRKYVKGIV